MHQGGGVDEVRDAVAAVHDHRHRHHRAGDLEEQAPRLAGHAHAEHHHVGDVVVGGQLELRQRDGRGVGRHGQLLGERGDRVEHADRVEDHDVRPRRWG